MADTSSEPGADRSYYALLGVAQSATDDEIKRAYRQLATTLHPDKVPDPARRDEAALLFTRIQEAYEVLSDPQRRDIYDVYGPDGLSAGLEVGDKLKTRDELRQEWESFRSKQKKEQLEAQVAYRGVYVFKVDATALINPYMHHLARMPELSSIYMTSGLDVPLESKDWGWLGSEQDVAHLGGMVSVRKNVGGGSFMAGYKRAFADYSSLEVQGAVGMRTLLTAQHSVALSPESSASLAASWQPNAGMGLQFATTRQLTPTVSGEYSWVVGPEESAGMSLGLTRRTEKLLLAARLEVGAVTGIVARAVRQLSSAITGRLSLKVTTAGVEVDAGGNRRFSEVATGGCSVVVGMQGITLKLRYNRAGHLFEFPVLLSSSPFDLPTLAGAYLLPPLLYWVGRDWVLGPLRQGIEARRSRGERQKQAEVIRRALALSCSAAQLMLPVAQRRLGKEQRHGGLVVVLALYGEESAVRQTAEEAPRRWAAAIAAAQQQQQQEQQEGDQQQGSPPQRQQAAGGSAVAAATMAAEQQAASAAAAAACAAPGAGGEAQQEAAGGGRVESLAPAGVDDDLSPTGAEDDVPPAVADVTVAVQYLVDGGKVAFHSGYAKSGLMGFCDPAPGATKLLLVYYTFKGRAYRATISDAEGAQLPGRGLPVEDEREAEFVLQLATQLGEAAAGGNDSGLGTAPPVAGLGGGGMGGSLWIDNPSFLSAAGSSTVGVEASAGLD